MTKNLIGSAQAAKAFGVNRATFNRWVTRGDIVPAAKLDGATGARLFDADQIAAMAAERAKAEGAA